MTIAILLSWCCLVAITAIGIIEYLKTIKEAVKKRKVSLGMVAAPFVCLAAGYLLLPLIYGSEIEGIIATIHYAAGLGIVAFALMQLFYDLLIRSASKLLAKVIEER